MEALLTALANVGGLGIFAAALLVLHREAIAAFREELRAERESFNARNAAVVSEMREHHEATMTALREQHDTSMLALRELSLAANLSRVRKGEPPKP